jgi:hypothetical protein
MTTIDAPASAVWTDSALTETDTVAEQRSVYTGAESRLDFGGGGWALTLATPPMAHETAAELSAWASRLRAADAVARLPRPPYYARYGTTTANTLALSAARSAGAASLAITGLGSGLTIAAGTLVSVGDHLHRVQVTLTDGVSDALLIWPPLRADAADGATVEINAGVRGLWRLQARPVAAWAVGDGSAASPYVFQFREAI